MSDPLQLTTDDLINKIADIAMSGLNIPEGLGATLATAAASTAVQLVELPSIIPQGLATLEAAASTAVEKAYTLPIDQAANGSQHVDSTAATGSKIDDSSAAAGSKPDDSSAAAGSKQAEADESERSFRVRQPK